MPANHGDSCTKEYSYFGRKGFSAAIAFGSPNVRAAITYHCAQCYTFSCAFCFSVAFCCVY